MRIAVPVAEFHEGNTSEYVQAAFRALGHEAQILDRSQFAMALQNSSFDYFFCVDSGGVFDFTAPEFAQAQLSRVGYWFIDFRHHWDGTTRSPGDLAVAHELSSRGGWIFQSQYEDWERCQREGIERSSWLALAADPQVWSPTPVEAKEFDIGFVGNVWDRGRADALQILLNQRDLRVGFFGHGALWKEDGAALLRRSKIGFNITSYFGTEHAFDVNMRVFETLSCGTPLLTNAVPSLARVFPDDVPFLRTYHSRDDLIPILRNALADPDFLTSGAEAARWIANGATYSHRMSTVLSLFDEM